MVNNFLFFFLISIFSFEFQIDDDDDDDDEIFKSARPSVQDPLTQPTSAAKVYLIILSISSY